MEVVNPSAAPPLLTMPAERREILAQTELDYAVILRFDDRLRAMEPERFVRDILLERLLMRELVIGEDHGFGRGRQGDVAMLQRLGARLGFAVDVVPPVHRCRCRVSCPAAGSGPRWPTATWRSRAVVRQTLRLCGVVIEGARRGRSIGVPTINLPVPPRKVLPPDGVYAVRVEWPGGRRRHAQPGPPAHGGRHDPDPRGPRLRLRGRPVRAVGQDGMGGPAPGCEAVRRWTISNSSWCKTG